MRKKLIITNMVIILIAAAITAGFIYSAVSKIQQEASASRLMETAQMLLLEAEKLDPSDLGELADRWGAQKGNYRITFIQKDGTVLGDSGAAEQTMENHSTRPEVLEAWATGHGEDQRVSATTGMPSLYAAATDKTGQLLVRVALPLHELELTQKAVVNRSVLGVFFALIIAFALLSQLSARLLKPLQRLRLATQSMAAGHYETRVPPEKDEAGALGKDFNHMAATLQQTLDRLQQQRQLVNTVLNHVSTGIIAIDEDGHLLLANPLAREIFRLPLGKPASTLDSNLLHRDPELWQLLEKTLKTGEIQETELNRRRFYQVTTALLPMEAPKEAAGQTEAPSESKPVKYGVVMAIQDLTRIRKLEELRTEFVSNATHELRTPLTSIQGYIETLNSNADLTSEVKSEILTILEIESHRLSNLIDDMLTLSEIENRPASMNEESCLPAEIARDVIALLQPQADQAGITLSLQTLSSPKIRARKDWLRRMLINLIDNAIKYNKKGGQVTVILDSPSPQRLRIAVEDTGIGIPQEHINRIFERFYRVDKSHSRETGGTGLGLAIVKHLVQLYGGVVLVSSEEGKGTRFVIELPAE
jgi:two-component system phosphate regulon sensor histidine kinase PhoR